LTNVTKFKDIVLPNLKKILRLESEIFSDSSAEVVSIEDYMRHHIIDAYHDNAPFELLQKGYYFSDSEDIVYASYDVFSSKVLLTHKLGLSFDTGYFHVKEQNNDMLRGYRYGLSLHYDKWTFRIGKNHYNNFSEFTPTLRYISSYKKHEYQIEYTHQNALFYVFRESAISKQIKADHLNISDFVSLANETSLWSSWEINRYSIEDVESTLQYDWKFLFNKTKNIDFSYDLALEGWYDMHSKGTDYFYSPKFADTTTLRLDANYKFSKYISTRLFAGLGYSFYDKYVPYKYGMQLFSNEVKNLSYNVNCLYSNSIHNVSSSSYNYIECNFSLRYTW